MTFTGDRDGVVLICLLLAVLGGIARGLIGFCKNRCWGIVLKMLHLWLLRLPD